jgi:hypothetical protein
LKKDAVFIEGSILDRPKLTDIVRGCDCIVHIAAWHGIHEDRGEKSAELSWYQDRKTGKFQDSTKTRRRN